MSDSVIGIDVGTTACKVVAVDIAGSVYATASADYPLLQPEPGAAEQDTADIWQAVCRAIVAVAREVRASRLAAVSLSGAMHSLIALDESNQSLTNAMTWADTRCTDAIEEHVAGYARTGCPNQPIYHPARLRWLKNKQPDCFDTAARFAGIKDWLVWKLCGRWATDYAMASATGLLNIHDLSWDESTMALAGVCAEQLPDVMVPWSVVGKIDAKASDLTGLPVDLPVVLGTSDGAAANLGAGAGEANETVITVGTSGAVRHMVNQPRLDPEHRTWCYAMWPNHWLAGGAINNGGLAVKWLAQRFYEVDYWRDALPQIVKDVQTIEPGSDGLMLLPYFAGERSPHYRTDATGAFIGMNLSHTRAHLARATVEAVAFCLADVAQAVGLDASDGKAVRLTGGITHMQPWCQIVADVLGVSIEPIDVADASAIGAALLGHWAAGHVPVEQCWWRGRNANVIHPDREAHQAYQTLHQQFRARWALAVPADLTPPATD